MRKSLIKRLSIRALINWISSSFGSLAPGDDISIDSIASNIIKEDEELSLPSLRYMFSNNLF
jgi:hypothetical protein